MIATSFCNLLSQSILFSRFVHFDMKIKFAHFSCFSLFEFMIHYSFIPLMRYDVKFPRFFIIAHNTARETLLQFSFCICGIAFLEYIPKNGIVESSTCPNIVKVLFQMVLANYNWTSNRWASMPPHHLHPHLETSVLILYPSDGITVLFSVTLIELPTFVSLIFCGKIEFICMPCIQRCWGLENLNVFYFDYEVFLHMNNSMYALQYTWK